MPAGSARCTAPSSARAATYPSARTGCPRLLRCPIRWCPWTGPRSSRWSARILEISSWQYRSRAAAQVGSNGWDIPQLLEQRGLRYEQDDNYITNSGERATRYTLEVCPFNAAHNDRSACIVHWASGALAFKCHHDGCLGKGWADLKALWQLPASSGITAQDIILPAGSRRSYCRSSAPTGSARLHRTARDARRPLSTDRWVSWC